MKFGGEPDLPNKYSDETMPPPYNGSSGGERVPTFADDSPYGGLDDKTIRRGFIRKVFSILLVQLSITFGFVLLSYQLYVHFLLILVKCSLLKPGNPGFCAPDAIIVFYFVEILDNVSINPYCFLAFYYYFDVIPAIFSATFLVTYITLACCKGVARKTPWNYVFLSLLTLSMTYMLAMITAFYSSEIVLVALAITVCVCFSVILFSMQTKYDFTGAIGPLFAASIALLVLGIIAMFWRNKIVHIIYSGLGAILFSAFLAVDVQMIMGGKRFEISAEDYIFGALMLYLDIVYIFIYILSIFSSARE